MRLDVRQRFFFDLECLEQVPLDSNKATSPQSSSNLLVETLGGCIFCYRPHLDKRTSFLKQLTDFIKSLLSIVTWFLYSEKIIEAPQSGKLTVSHTSFTTFYSIDYSAMKFCSQTQ